MIQRILISHDCCRNNDALGSFIHIPSTNCRTPLVGLCGLTSYDEVDGKYIQPRIGQTVLAQVVKVDRARQRFLLSLKVC
jgi:hypothetical protein